MQNEIKINGVKVFQPDEDMGWSFETTYSEGSTRTQAGKGRFTPLFTVEQLSYSASDVPIAEASLILNMVARGKNFSLFYFSAYYGRWRTDTFYVGQGEISIGTLEEDGERLSSLSFNMTGVNPLT